MGLGFRYNLDFNFSKKNFERVPFSEGFLAPF